MEDINDFRAVLFALAFHAKLSNPTNAPLCSDEDVHARVVAEAADAAEKGVAAFVQRGWSAP